MTSETHSKLSLLIAILFAATIAVLPSSITHAAVTYRTVVLEDDTAPGTAPGYAFIAFDGAPTINNAGHVAFRGIIRADGPPTDGFWSEGGGSLNLITKQGDPAPGTGQGVIFEEFSTNTPVIDAMGQTAFSAKLGGSAAGSNNRLGIWSQASGSLSLLAQRGSHAPGTPSDVTFGNSPTFPFTFSRPVLNSSGQAAFGASLGTDFTTNETGIWMGKSNTLDLVVREGSTAPGMTQGTVFSHLYEPVLNNAGQVGFRASTSGTDTNFTNNETIWSGDIFSMRLAAREGDPAPGTAAGVLFGSATVNGPTFGNPAINNTGQTAFLALLRGTDVDDNNIRGIWSEGGGSLHMVAREGDPVPDIPNFLFNMINNPPLLNNAGHTVFVAAINRNYNPTSNNSIWLDVNGSLTLIAREGDAAPGTTPGVVYSVFGSTPKLIINSTGQIAYTGFLTGPGVDSSNRTGLWATDLFGVPQLITRTGDTIDVNDDVLIDDMRTISSIALTAGSGGEDGRATSLNDAGQLTLRLHFTDSSSGIFVINTRLPGDLNSDGFVGIEDLTTVLSNWNQSVTPGDSFAGDPTGDGFVGIADLNAVLGNWNAGTPPTNFPVPEPAVLILFAPLLGLFTSRPKRASINCHPGRSVLQHAFPPITASTSHNTALTDPAC